MVPTNMSLSRREKTWDTCGKITCVFGCLQGAETYLQKQKNRLWKFK